MILTSCVWRGIWLYNNKGSSHCCYSDGCYGNGCYDIVHGDVTVSVGNKHKDYRIAGKYAKINIGTWITMNGDKFTLKFTHKKHQHWYKNSKIKSYGPVDK